MFDNECIRAGVTVYDVSLELLRLVCSKKESTKRKCFALISPPHTHTK